MTESHYNKPIEIFYSYSQKDLSLRDKLEVHLSTLKQKGIISSWHDRDINAGSDWSREIDRHLNVADLILLLISPDFIASDYAYKIEMKRALERHEAGEARVIPIILRPTDLKGVPFENLQCLPAKAKPITSWPNEDDAFLVVVQGIRKVVESMNTISLSDSPGEIRFTNDRLPPRVYGKLLGRGDDMERVMEGLDSRFPLITIEGFAGVGKTSLAVEVGYVCLLKAESDIAQPVTFEYVIWISAKDKPEQKQWLDEVLNEVAEVMGYRKITQKPPERIEEKKKEIENLLRGYRVLVIIDNFETIEDADLVSWVHRVPEPSKVLVTTRTRQLHAAWTIELKGLQDDEALKLIRQYAYALGLRQIVNENDDKLLSLVKVTVGNPKALELALGHIKGGRLSLNQIINQIFTNNPNKSMEAVFEYLHSESWKSIKPEARNIVLVTPLFVGVSSISRDALLTASGLSAFDFEEALQQLLDWRLLEPELENDRLIIHSITREFAKSKLNKEFENEARNRWSSYYLKFVKDNIEREKPKTRYWNALVTKRMDLIDEEWEAVLEVMKWADEQKQDKLLLDLVMLLVHYMDSRLKNLERLTFVKKAIGAARRMDLKYDEALLRIDALGWTYVEENHLEEAYDEIMRGFAIAEAISGDNAEANDLMALGFAWRARVRIEQGRSKEAVDLIKRALSIECSSWIRYRVYMAAGDIAFKQGQGEDALNFYENAVLEYKNYGEEGQGYQIDPRIGLAYLEIDQVDKAEEKFKDLRDQEKISIGKLYAEYGIALVAYKRGDTRSARVIVNKVKEELSRQTTSNLLLNLINDLFKTLETGNN